MGFESPNSIDGSVEKPKTFREFIEAVSKHSEKQADNTKLKNELDFLNGFVEYYGSRLLDQPIGAVIDEMEKHRMDIEKEHKEASEGNPTDSTDLAIKEGTMEGLAKASDDIADTVHRMSQFEQGQLYKQ